MDTKKFILLISCITAMVCLITVVYNFASMPPYGTQTVSAIPLYVSNAQPLSFTQSSTIDVSGTSSAAVTSTSSASNDDADEQTTTASTATTTTSTVSVSQKSTTTKTGSTSTTTTTVLAKATPQDPININTATLAQLEMIPNVGVVKAQAILSYRTAHGNFSSVSALDNVKGIGPKTITKITPYITVH